MSRAMLFGTVALAALAVVFALRSDSRGEGAPKSTGSPAEAARKQSAQKTGTTAVAQALAEGADFNFIDTPLITVAAFVSDHFKINVLLDDKSLADAGVTPKTTITQRATGIPLRSALHLLLSSKDLDFVQSDDNVLTITTADVAKSRTTMQMYDVRKFADPEVEFSPGPTSWSKLSEVVTSIVSPTSWNSNGGAGSLAFIDGNMIVTQSDEIQSQITDLLSLLETARQEANEPGGEVPITLDPPDAAESRIEKSLESRQDFIFTDIRLGDVVQMLSKQLGITVVLDTKALADAGITPETPLSIKLKQVRARVGLQALLGSKDLTFLIDHDVLIITTGDVAKTKTVTKLYPVKDLVGAINPATGEIDFQSLVETITGTVVPAAWDSNGGAGSIEPFPICKVLAISQTEQIHQQIKELLTTLRAARKSNPPPAVVPSTAMVLRTYSLRTLTDAKESQQVIEMVRRIIEPKSWTDPNAYIGVVAGSIVVRQSPEVQFHIQHLLNALALTPSAGTTGATAAPTPAGGSTGIGFGGGAF